MAETDSWDDLSKFEQRALIKLFGGGTLRNDHPNLVESLRVRGMVDEDDKLSASGLLVLTLAMRRQQVGVRSRLRYLG